MEDLVRSKRKFSFPLGWLLNLSLKKKLYLIIGLLIGNIVLIISLGTFALNTLSSIRAAITGEDLWAKAQKTAIYSLRTYALLQDEEAYQQYLEAIKIPMAYDRANREFKKTKPNLTIVSQAFIEGGIHPKDIAGVARLFIYFQWVPHVATSFRAWAEAQALVEEVQNLARQLRAEHLSRKTTGKEVGGFVSRPFINQPYIKQIDNLNQKITALEIQYSSDFGEVSRWAADVFTLLMVGGSLFVGLLSVVIAFFISNEIVYSIGKISEAAAQAANGDLKVRVAIDTEDELGNLANAFNHMTEGLGKFDRLKTEFFSNVSHEFRTPLTLILAPLEDLLSTQNSTLSRESLETVYRNALRLLKLVNSLLDFSRLEAGRLKALYVPTDLSSCTRELASHFESVVEKAGLKFIVDCKPSPEPLYVDRDLWEKIVLNLLSNALKFTFEGKISICFSYDASGGVLEVQDTGTGIPKNEMPHLFGRFHRIKGARSRTYEGSGIGLSLVKELALLHGGNIEAESSEGKGTKFTVHIPFGYAHFPPDQVAQVSTSSPFSSSLKAISAHIQESFFDLSEEMMTEPLTSVEASSTEKPRILIVDDNADMRTYITRLLLPQWEVETAQDGSEALESIRRRLPDLVLSDIMMPKMNGFELLQALRQDPATKHLSIILLSARAGEESRTEGITAGADDYLVKPFSGKELIARVNTHLNLSRVRKEVVTNAAIVLRLQSEQKWLESTLDFMPIPLLLIEPSSGRVTFSNRAADLMAGGVFPKNIPMENYTESYRFTDENDQELSVDKYPFVRAARGEKIEGESLVWHSSAGRFTILMSTDTLTEMHGHPKTIILAFQDVTALSKAIRSRDEFLSIASHELKTPITSLKMQLQLAQREIKPEKGIVPPLERLTKLLYIFNLQIDRLTSLVEGLLDVSRIQAGKLNLNIEPCNLSKLIKQVIERFNPQLIYAQCSIEFNIDEGVTGLWDQGRIEQVVSNLVSNAIKYAPGKPIRISLATRQDYAYFTIQDFGPGIEKEKQVKIFERFERAVSSQNISGLGLGLFISKQIIKAHGGLIDLWSESGKGSVFTVTIPIRPIADVNGDKGIDEPFLNRPIAPLRPGEGIPL